MAGGLAALVATEDTADGAVDIGPGAGSCVGGGRVATERAGDGAPPRHRAIAISAGTATMATRIKRSTSGFDLRSCMRSA